ncbi:hypothetical protein Kpol_1017p12 [Vanderwaltozyma polyspora DSM 70294]|uniref:CCAAT-binding factor domain-containing protein n=1 Tax=Vanderwaltozyma polyspora (strain ATCC 22028 / DSM 70294 / BCRC 21397 / CBS 2163 / NBRC 10782 / NRRL Y-8283 / UCD 57-17) TaxID=436907 RepID=A7TRD9_VANPO|nr:uncharacterized protein Kpol_1017p12 [Vanderwaltozyma polyspora DSM 70294]EDO15178.1 hypothetical protein Kpol_1017p12 [Vanderwaltozyma polyspora DSM 70294]
MSLSMEDIKKNSKLIVASDDKTNYNFIVKLIKELTINDENIVDEQYWEGNEQKLRFVVVSLFQIFKKLFNRNEITMKKSKSTEIMQFRDWCKKMFESFKNCLLNIIQNIPFETSISLDCLDIYMQLLELESEYFSSGEDDPYFPNISFRKLLTAIWNSNFQDEESENGQSINSIVIEFTNSYYKKFADIQFYFQAELNKFLCDENEKVNYTTINGVGKWMTIVNHDVHCSNTNEEDSLEVFVSNPPKIVEDISKFKANFESNWLHMLNSDLTVGQYKSILLVLHKRIIPIFNTPSKLMDFLTDSYNVNIGKKDNNSGLIPILALNGLFELMRLFNLEYPNFYPKLYQCLVPDLMHVKYRSRFFRLIDLFLSSSHLSTHLIASFIKKLARLSLTAPPAAIVTIIPFIYNLLRKHPNCMIMLHNPMFIENAFATDEERMALRELKLNYKDSYDDSETNPELTNAINSSLWEIVTLMDHYHPNVATLAKIFAQPFKKLNYNMEDFLDWSYDSLLSAESTRKLKVLPTLEFESFDHIFGEVDEEKGVETEAYLVSIDW